MNYGNKYVYMLKQILLTKNLYVSNRLYQLSEQICICVKYILQTVETKKFEVTNKLN
jgi:hypothetical protein